MRKVLAIDKLIDRFRREDMKKSDMSLKIINYQMWVSFLALQFSVGRKLGQVTFVSEWYFKMWNLLVKNFRSETKIVVLKRTFFEIQA